MITAKLLEIDRPTINGRVYPKAVVEAALKHWFDHFGVEKMPIFKAPTATPKMDDIVGMAENFRFEDGYLTADVGFFEDRKRDVGAEGEVINIRPNGIGGVDAETGIVSEGYRIFGLVIRHQNPVVGAVIKESSDEKK